MTVNRCLFPYKEFFPLIHDNVFLADGAKIIGNVEIASYGNIWFNTVVRGDVNKISIGSYTNIQDNCTLHAMNNLPCIIGDYVTVGHGVILHGCTVSPNCLIGMGAIILNGVEIGENCIIGAGTLITENKKIPPNSMVIGSPGKVVRTINDDEILAIKNSAIDYYEFALNYR